MRRLIPVFLLLLPVVVFAQREAVLKQIDLPHSYYFREMYLPQLTSGPSSAGWSPDGRALVYSMQGSIWRQDIGTTTATQLTSSPGYDYQPDWSPDGRRIAFARYHKDAVEIILLDLEAKKESTLTTGGAVNVEPRWSPDGKRLAFVSTMNTGHFHIHVMEIGEGTAGTPRLFTPERRSTIQRYYYSPFDHELSPSWSPDGTEILYVSNPERYYGTGGFFRKKLDASGDAQAVHYEETTWKSRPDWSRDGKRIVYSSYHGRQWNQLWVTSPEGGDPFAITYGEYDNTAPRWSPDGKKIAFISNRDGNTSLWIQEWIGGKQTPVLIKERKYLNPTATLDLTVLGPDGKTAPARVSVTGADTRTYAPDDAWIHADDNFDRKTRPFEAHYFHSSGKSVVTVPAGKVTVDVMRGFEHLLVKQDLQLNPGERKQLTVKLKPLELPSTFGRWYSGDVHVHMNYGGTYRNTPERMIRQAEAENLAVVHNLIVNKEQRIPDIDYFRTSPDPASTAANLLLHEQEYHTSFWGHLGLLNLKSHYLLPDYSSYANTAAASPYPTNSVVADVAHEQKGLVGYVHPWDWDPDPAKEKTLTNELPVDVALGKVDYYEVLGFSDHHATAHVWYRLLNCGFRISAAGGTDAMANFASLRGPAGLTRTYVQLDGPLNADDWIEGLRKGRTFATNGPLVALTLNGKTAGDEIKFSAGGGELTFHASARSIVPLDHLEIVYNGKVLKTLELSGDRTVADVQGALKVDRSGWLVLRAWNDKAADAILDLYPYASTGPIYINVDNQPVKSEEDAAYFRAWIDRIIEGAEKHTGYLNQSEKDETLRILRDGRKVYE